MTLPKPYFEQDNITIYHGDSRELLSLIDPKTVDLVLTDPPYGISFDTNFKRFTGGVGVSCGTHTTITGDAVPFEPSTLTNTFKKLILFGANSFSERLPQGSWLVWDKRTPKGSKNVMSDGEVAWFSKGHGVYIFSHTWDGFNRASERRTAFHPTQKPVALMEWIINRWTKPNDLVLDPYMGSGPVAVAALNLGRRYIGIELEEKYCEIAANRILNATSVSEAA